MCGEDDSRGSGRNKMSVTSGSGDSECEIQWSKYFIEMLYEELDRVHAGTMSTFLNTK